VRFQVLAEGQRGLLGVGYSPARVFASVRVAPAPPERASSDAELRPETEQGRLVQELLERVTAALGADVRIALDEREDPLRATCSGEDVAVVIGRRGQTIDAIQYLANAIVARALPEQRKEVVIDAAGYRARRQATLEDLALRSADQAIATGAPVALEPMTAVERKVVHVRLQDHDGVETTSDGTEPNRHVVVRAVSHAGSSE